MYFPYLRGRQSELLAIRTLLEKKRLSERVVPIIEPIKPTATLRKTLEAFINHRRELYIVANPQVGEFHKEVNSSSESSDEFNELINNDQFKKVTIITREQDINKDQSAYIFGNADHLAWFEQGDEKGDLKLLIITDQSDFRRGLSSEKKLDLQVNHFNPETRNADYLPLSPRPFTSDHLHYAKEGYYGFSDYSIVGTSFMEGGFAPRAVAIHMVYFTEHDELRIRHFTSETNDDITNPAGKFNEALSKLVNYFKGDPRNKTLGLTKFREHHDNGTYPWVGSAKQLSIVHHLDLMVDYLKGDKK